MDQHIAEFPMISDWLKQQPLSILALDAADRIVLFIAGMFAISPIRQSDIKIVLQSLPNR